MIPIKNKLAFAKMEKAGALLAQVMQMVSERIKEGVTTAALDKYVGLVLPQKGLKSSTKGYMGYRHFSCISLNEEVVHGVPSIKKVIKNGDVVKVDLCASWNGYCADMARTFCVGTVSEAAQLITTAQRALDKGIEMAVPGKKVGDISWAVQQEVERDGFGVVRDFAGHGIGKKLHEEPEVLNYGRPHTGPLLRVGMALAIEPMITAGGFEVYVEKDGWTVKTCDKSLAVHVEDTVLITENGPCIVTRL